MILFTITTNVNSSRTDLRDFISKALPKIATKIASEQVGLVIHHTTKGSDTELDRTHCEITHFKEELSVEIEDNLRKVAIAFSSFFNKWLDAKKHELVIEILSYKLLYTREKSSSSQEHIRYYLFWLVSISVAKSFDDSSKHSSVDTGGGVASLALKINTLALKINKLGSPFVIHWKALTSHGVTVLRVGDREGTVYLHIRNSHGPRWGKAGCGDLHIKCFTRLFQVLGTEKKELSGEEWV